MRKITGIITAIAAAVLVTALTACATLKNGGNVPYFTANNYFFKNDATMPASPKITTAEDFYNLFGEATYMGKNGMATRIDFNTKFVIAVILPETDEETDLKPVRLTRKDGKLVFSYNVTIGRKQSYKTRPVMLIVVDKKYDKGEVELNPTTVVNDQAS